VALALLVVFVVTFDVMLLVMAVAASWRWLRSWWQLRPWWGLWPHAVVAVVAVVALLLSVAQNCASLNQKW